jgi:3-oxoadipate enol-lactonase
MTRVPTGRGEFYLADDDFADPWRPHGTILMVPGFCRTSEFWRAWVPTLARHYRVLRLDPRGSGRSPNAAPGSPFDLELLADDCAAVLAALPVDRVHIVGESIGGMVGVVLAARRTGLVRSLTLVSTPVRIPDSTRGRNALGYADWKTALAELGLHDWWLRSREAAGEAVLEPAAEDFFAREVALAPLATAYAMIDMGGGEDIGPVMGDVDVPTLVLTPERSANIGPAQRSEMTDQMPTAREIVVRDALHGMYYQRADELAGHTLAFLRELEA